MKLYNISVTYVSALDKHTCTVQWDNEPSEVVAVVSACALKMGGFVSLAIYEAPAVETAGDPGQLAPVVESAWNRRMREMNEKKKGGGNDS